MDILRCAPRLEPTAKKKSRLSYSITFKLAAVRHAEIHGNRATARYLGINEKQIRDWRSKKMNLMNTNSSAKRLKGAGRQVTDTKREKELKEWLDHEKNEGRFISRADVLEKAKSFSENAEFKASAGWLRRWKIRHNVNLSQSATFASMGNSLMATPFGTIVPSDNFGLVTSYKKSHDREKEYRDRITCALALLELKSPIIRHMYKGVY